MPIDIEVPILKSRSWISKYIIENCFARCPAVHFGMKVLLRFLFSIAVLVGDVPTDAACQVPGFSHAQLYRCHFDEKKPATARQAGMAALTDHLVIDSPGVQIRAQELCIIRQLFLELPTERRHRDTMFTYLLGGLVDYPDFLVVLFDASRSLKGAVLIEQDRASAGYHEISGTYRTLHVQEMQIDLFLQLTAIHHLDR